VLAAVPSCWKAVRHDALAEAAHLSLHLSLAAFLPGTSGPERKRQVSSVQLSRRSVSRKKSARFVLCGPREICGGTSPSCKASSRSTKSKFRGR
jgi:hypothetical protein